MQCLCGVLKSSVKKVMILSCPQGPYGLIEDLSERPTDRSRGGVAYKGTCIVFLQVAVDFTVLIMGCLGQHLIYSWKKEAMQNYELIELYTSWTLYVSFHSPFKTKESKSEKA